MICQSCRDRAAVSGTDLCRACAAAEERADRRARPDYYHALSMARRIDLYDVRRAGEVWAAWPGWQRYPASENHAQVGARCVATLDGLRWHAGVVVAVERKAEQPGQAYRPRVTAYWVWLVKPSDELIVPVLRFEKGNVEIVRREREEMAR